MQNCPIDIDEMCKWLRKRVNDQIYKEFMYSNDDDKTVTITTPYTWVWDYDLGAYTARVSNTRKALSSKISKHKKDYDNTSEELDNFLSEFKVKEAVGNG